MRKYQNGSYFRQRLTTQQANDLKERNKLMEELNSSRRVSEDDVDYLKSLYDNLRVRGALPRRNIEHIPITYQTIPDATQPQQIVSPQVTTQPVVPITTPKSDYKGISVVDYIKSLNLGADRDNRKKLAEILEIKNYNFSAAKNLELLAKLRGEKFDPKQAQAVINNAPSGTRRAINQHVAKNIGNKPTPQKDEYLPDYGMKQSDLIKQYNSYSDVKETPQKYSLFVNDSQNTPSKDTMKVNSDTSYIKRDTIPIIKDTSYTQNQSNTQDNIYTDMGELNRRSLQNNTPSWVHKLPYYIGAAASAPIIYKTTLRRPYHKVLGNIQDAMGVNREYNYEVGKIEKTLNKVLSKNNIIQEDKLAKLSKSEAKVVEQYKQLQKIYDQVKDKNNFAIRLENAIKNNVRYKNYKPLAIAFSNRNKLAGAEKLAKVSEEAAIAARRLKALGRTEEAIPAMMRLNRMNTLRKERNVAEAGNVISKILRRII